MTDIKSDCPMIQDGVGTCWLDLARNGSFVSIEEASREQVARCIQCPRFQEALGRSVGRRSSDRLISSAVNRFLTVLSNYNTELSAMTSDLNRNVEELTVLKTVTEAFLKTYDLNSCMRIFLTGVTAGEAIGLNRAALFLVNHGKRTLEGQLGFGHIDLRRYSDTWRVIQNGRLSFQDLIRKIVEGETKDENELTGQIRRVRVPLREEFGALPKAVLHAKTYRFESAAEEDLLDRTLLSIFVGRPVAIVPIVSKDHALGAVIVDNPVTGEEITERQVSKLETLSYIAAAKIDNVILQNQLEVRIAELEHLHRLLKDNQKYMVEAERFVEAGKLVNTLAHEIKTPLVTIGGYSRRAERTYAKGDDISHELSIITSEISRLENIARHVLDYSRKRKLDLKVVDINDIMKETLEVLEGKLSLDEIDIESDFSDARLEVKADKSWLKQVVFNILDNAIAAMDERGSLVLNTGSIDGYHWFEIRDTGTGMDEETISQLFEPFFTTKDTGSGLGLPVSKRIVADHGGYIEVASEPDQGSAFKVFLPEYGEDE